MKKTPFDLRIKVSVDNALDEIEKTVKRLRATESTGGGGLSVTTRALVAMKTLMAAVTKAMRGIMDALIGKSNDDEVSK